MKTLIVVPARYASTRLPHKLLLAETGKTLIQHTYEAAARSTLAQRVVVATDHPMIFSAVQAFGGEAVMTDPNANSGTDRVAEIAGVFTDYELFVNVQGDEPELEPSCIDAAITAMQQHSDWDVATLATAIRSLDRLHNPNCVKVVCDDNGRALYFSRSPIPYARDWDDSLLQSPQPLFLQHIGLYAYRRSFLSKLPQMTPSVLETAEKLEQLRFLQNGYTIGVSVVQHSVAGIDVREDYDAFVRRQREVVSVR